MKLTKCEKCIFWERLPPLPQVSVEAGVCRRNPPVFVEMPSSITSAYITSWVQPTASNSWVQPITASDSWVQPITASGSWVQPITASGSWVQPITASDSCCGGVALQWERT